MMNKFTLLIVAMLLSFMSFGDNWTEDFETNPSTNYGDVSVDINGRTWTKEQAGNFGFGNSTVGSYAFTINDDKVGAHITTPVLNTCGTVSFQYAYKNGNPDNVFKLQKSTDGTIWSDLDEHTLTIASDQTLTDYSFDVNESSATVYIRILSDDQNAHLFIDNFTVSDYSSSPTLTWNGTTFTEAAANNGMIGNTISVTLASETFATVGDLTAADFTATNVPTDLTVEITTTDANNATVTLSGTAAAHDLADGITNLTIAFEDAAFTTGPASNVSNYENTMLEIVYFDTPPVKELTWNQTTFTEDAANNGMIENTISITLANETFATLGDLTAADFTATNVPTDLAVEITTIDANNATITLSGTAAAHDLAASIANLTIAFEDAVFTNDIASNVVNSTNSTLNVNFLDPYVIPELVITEIMYNTPGMDNAEFIEIFNNGATAVDLTDYSLGAVVYTFPSITLNAGEYVVISNSATEMLNIYGVTTLEWTSGSLVNSSETISLFNPGGSLVDEVTYDDDAPWPTQADGSGPSLVLCDYTSDNNNAANWLVSTSLVDVAGVNFYASPMAEDNVCTAKVLTWNETVFTEDAANNGMIGNTISVSLTNETFATLGALTATDFTATNVPTDLTVEITTTDANNATVTLSGTAATHEFANSISDLTISFQDAAFSGSSTSTEITNSTNSNLSVDFIDAVPVLELTWNETVFTEEVANTGMIGNTISVTLANETFATLGALTAADFTATNVPTGLNVEIATTDANNATVTLSGTAATHEFANSITDLTISFQDAAFSGSSTSSEIINSTNSNLLVNFFDPFTIPELVITEIMYNGPEAGTDTIEFIEIFNKGAETVNLNGYSMEGVSHVFGNVTIDPQTYGVICVNAEAYNNTYGIQTIEWTSGGLSNSGETIKILNPGGDVVDEVTFGNANDWPSISSTSANLGHSIVLCDYDSDNNVGTNWMLSSSSVGVQIDGKDVFASPSTQDLACTLNPLLVWNESTFNESNLDDGTIGNTISVTLTDVSFATVGNLTASDFSATHVPAGLTVEIESTDANNATISLTGTADSHLNTNDIDDLTIIFLEAAFTGTQTVTDASNTTIIVDFIDDVSVNSINKTKLSIYPNPTKGIFTVEGQDITKVEILDITGKKIKSLSNTKNTFDLSNEKNGVYFIKVYTENSLVVEKIILNK